MIEGVYDCGSASSPDLSWARPRSKSLPIIESMLLKTPMILTARVLGPVIFQVT